MESSDSSSSSLDEEEEVEDEVVEDESAPKGGRVTGFEASFETLEDAPRLEEVDDDAIVALIVAPKCLEARHCRRRGRSLALAVTKEFSRPWMLIPTWMVSHGPQLQHSIFSVAFDHLLASSNVLPATTT